MLLKAFDRGFWLKYFKEKKSEESEEQYQERLKKCRYLEEEKKCMCPFGDPTVSATRMGVSTRVAKREYEYQNSPVEESPPEMPEKFQGTSGKCLLM